MKVGDDNVIDILVGTTQVNRVYKGEEIVWNKSLLPSEYQEVEYIESTGTQYIDTQYYAIPRTSRIEAQLILTLSGNLTQALIGARIAITDYDSRYNLFWNSSAGRDKIRIDSMITENNRKDFLSSEISLNEEVNLYYINTEAVINGVSYYNDKGNKPNIKMDYSIFINNINSGGEPYSQGAYAKWKSVKIYDSNNLVRNFIPCYRRSDEEIGLYDTVEGKFYTNAGTGTFTKGGNV